MHSNKVVIYTNFEKTKIKPNLANNHKIKRKMKNIFILLTFIISTFCYSQEINKPIEVNNYYSIKSQYLYNTFIKGEIHSKDGKIAEGELNYNVIVDKFHYVKDDILKTFTDNDIRRIGKIIIKNRQFIIKDKLVYEIVYADKLLLLKKRTAEQDDLNQNKGAYGISSNTTTNKKIWMLSHAIGHEMEKGALVNIEDDSSEAQIKIVESYKLLFNNQIYPANKKSFLKIYPNDIDKIKDFIKSNKIKFKKELDLIKVVKFCITLN